VWKLGLRANVKTRLGGQCGNWVWELVETRLRG